MYRIDMLGPAGIGKTTLHRILLQDADRQWISRKETNREIAGLDVTPAHGYLPPTAARVWARVIPRREWSGSPRATCRAWRRYLAWCDSMISQTRHDGPFLYLTRGLARHAAIVEVHGVSAPVLYHESISRRGLSFALRRSDGWRFIQDYCWWIPPPRKLIWLRANPETIVDRLATRNMVAVPQRGLNVGELLMQARWCCKALGMAASILGHRGTDVIEIDAEGDVGTVAGRLRDVLARA